MEDEEFPQYLDPIELLDLVLSHRIMSRADYADWFGVDVKTLTNWRCGNTRPSRPVQRLAAELKNKWKDRFDAN